LPELDLETFNQLYCEGQDQLTHVLLKHEEINFPLDIADNMSWLNESANRLTLSETS
jgi:hypothetical protein